MACDNGVVGPLRSLCVCSDMVGGDESEDISIFQFRNGGA
jgi:hypothetical protein